MATSRGQPRPDTSQLFCALEIPRFPAQALAAYNGQLRQRPFVVACQDAQHHKSTVYACSRQAADLGIAPGMPVAAISRRYPQVAVALRDKGFESAAIRELKLVCGQYSPEFDLRENGACCIDLAKTPASRTMSMAGIAVSLRRDIVCAFPLQEIAIGVSRSRIVAKLLATRAKPDGVCTCETGAESETLASIESRLLPDLSAQCRERLAAYGLCSVGQVRRLGRETLVRHFGSEGEKLYSMAHGISAVSRTTSPPLLSSEAVLERDTNDEEELRRKVTYHADRLCFLLKTDGHCIDRFMISITYGDNRSFRKTVHLPAFTSDYRTIADYAGRAFFELYRRRVAIKSLRLAAKNPQPDPGQMSLFETVWEQKQKAVGAQITRVRNKLCFDSIVCAVHV